MSKYFDKHYTVEEPDLHETQCMRDDCKGIFAVDYRWLPVEVDDEGSWWVIVCPYCGRKHREWI